jgi:hypothetical protein
VSAVHFHLHTQTENGAIVVNGARVRLRAVATVNIRIVSSAVWHRVVWYSGTEVSEKLHLLASEENLKTETLISSEIFVASYKMAWCHIPEYSSPPIVCICLRLNTDLPVNTLRLGYKNQSVNAV